MTSLRTITSCLIIVLVSASALTACGDGSHTLSTDDIAKQVANHYGEPHPKVLQVKSTETDNPPHDSMYLITLSGHFHKGTIKAQYLSFSALADKMYVWNIFGYNQSDQSLWQDMQLPQR